VWGGGRRRLNAIEEAELPSVGARRVLHLQCHFGRDSLCLAQRGAEVVGLDFSPAAISAARGLADEVGLAERARFVLGDVYAAPQVVPPPHGFDLVFVTWGAITWLPDIVRWAGVVAAMLRPGGQLYLAEGHPAAYVFDDEARTADGRPGFFAPYFSPEPILSDDPRDYIDREARLVNARCYSWIHPLGVLVSSLIGAGMTLEWLHEHDAVTWRMFECLVAGADGSFRWPDKPWLPLAFSLLATRRAG
jgi:SAM-dependent methyltransferase